jgi:hypothetical protein
VDTVVDPEASVATAVIKAAAIPPRVNVASITELMSIIVFTPFHGSASRFK